MLCSRAGDGLRVDKPQVYKGFSNKTRPIDVQSCVFLNPEKTSIFQLLPRMLLGSSTFPQHYWLPISFSETNRDLQGDVKEYTVLTYPKTQSLCTCPIATWSHLLVLLNSSLETWRCLQCPHPATDPKQPPHVRFQRFMFMLVSGRSLSLVTDYQDHTCLFKSTIGNAPTCFAFKQQLYHALPIHHARRNPTFCTMLL